MKLNILLLIGLCLCKLALSTSVRSQQLFDVVSKEIDSSAKMKARPQTKSLFQTNLAKPQRSNKNLFDSMNFSQVQEKTVEKSEEKSKENVSLFSAFQNESNKAEASTNVKMNNANSNKTNNKGKIQNKSNTQMSNTNSNGLSAKSGYKTTNSNKNKKLKSLNSSKNKKVSKSKIKTKTRNQLKNKSRKNKSKKSNPTHKKTINKNHNSSNSTNNKSSHKNASSTENKNYIKIGGSLSSESKNEIEIKKLKRDVGSLLEMNHKLLNKLKQTDEVNKKKRRFKKNVVSFIQKYDNDVTSLKKNIESSKDFVEQKIVQKNEEFQKLYESTEKNFEQLQTQVREVQTKLSQLETEEQKKLSELHSNFSIKDLNIKKKLDVEGISFMNKLTAKSLDMGNIKIDTEGVTFLNENVKLIVGTEIITVGQLLNNLASFKKLINICGENFEHCKPVTDEIIRDQAIKQQAILDSLKKLRHETTQVLSRHRRRNQN